MAWYTKVRSMENQMAEIINLQELRDRIASQAIEAEVRESLEYFLRFFEEKENFLRQMDAYIAAIERIVVTGATDTVEKGLSIDPAILAEVGDHLHGARGAFKGARDTLDTSQHWMEKAAEILLKELRTKD